MSAFKLCLVVVLISIQANVYVCQQFSFKTTLLELKRDVETLNSTVYVNGAQGKNNLELTKELEKTKDDITDLKLDIRAVQNILNIFTEQTTKLQNFLTDVSSLKKKIDNVEKENKELKKTVSALNALFIESENQVKSSKKDIKPGGSSAACYSYPFEDKQFPVFTWIIKEFSKLVIKSLECNPPQKITGHRLSIKICRQMKNNKPEMLVIFDQDENFPNELAQMTVYPHVFFIVQDVSGQKSPKNVILPIQHFRYGFTLKNSSATYDYFNDPIESPPSFKYLTKNLALYHRNETIQINVQVEHPSVTKQVHSYNGILAWTICGYENKKQAEVDGLVEAQLSPYFYTHPQGYRVQIWLYLNGFRDQLNNGVSIVVEFLTGVNDASLSGDYQYTITIEILNKNDWKKHSVHTVQWNLKQDSHFFTRGPAHKELVDDGFIQNDSLELIVNVKPTQ